MHHSLLINFLLRNKRTGQSKLKFMHWPICEQTKRGNSSIHWLIGCIINSNNSPALFTYTLISAANGFIDYTMGLWAHFPDYNFKKTLDPCGIADWAHNKHIFIRAGRTLCFVLMVSLSIHQSDSCISIYNLQSIIKSLVSPDILEKVGGGCWIGGGDLLSLQFNPEGRLGHSNPTIGCPKFCEGWKELIIKIIAMCLPKCVGYP